MNTQMNKYPEILHRSSFLYLLHLSVETQAYQFGRQASLHWLSVFPGDLGVRLLYAKLLAGDGKKDQALGILKNLVAVDPEFLEAYREIARITSQKDGEDYTKAVSALYLLGDEVAPSLPLAEWALPAYSILKNGENAKLGGEEAHKELFRRTNLPLVAIWTYLKTMLPIVPQETALNLLEYYHQQFNECVPVSLYLADLWMKLGREEEGIALVHECVALDVAGQTVTRLWGDDHPYRSLWLNELSIPFDLPVPAQVAVRFRGNWLGSGTVVNASSSSASQPETNEKIEEKPIEVSQNGKETESEKKISFSEIPSQEARDNKDKDFQEIEHELERVAKRLKKSSLSRLDGRYPVYVIFSSWQGLEQQYGIQTTKVIDLELKRLGEAIQKRTGWRFLVYYPDQTASVKPLGLDIVQNRDPWTLKLALQDLDHALAKKGEMIGALLIVGGANIVPFHALPNPADDYDQIIYSDNPYGTLDSNYFIPEWPVGRLPGVDNTSDAGLLLDAIRHLTVYHQRGGKKWVNPNGNKKSPFEFIKTLLHLIGLQKSSPNIGYSAAVWRRSSVAVFRPVGNPHHILISPPQDAASLNVDRLLKPELAYYNLHGLEDSGEWYGQRDPLETGAGIDYPVALSPTLLKRNGHAPRIIFSEACYGGHILGKTEDQAMALKFISVGALAIVASTAISYGSVNTPLIAADLLGNYLWQELRNGKCIGEALMLAKIELAREMNRRQGYLDPEDQKTLLSFVLYGDPLVRLNAGNVRRKSAFRLKKSPVIRTAGESEAAVVNTSINEKVVTQVKQMVREYLPGIENAEVKILSFSVPEDTGGKVSKNAGNASHSGEKYRVAMSKEIPYARSIHRHYAKATIDSKGNVVKLVVSR